MSSDADLLTDDDVKAHIRSADPVVAQLAKEVSRLRGGIKQHQAQTGHSLCWINDVALWEMVDTDPTYPHDTLPVRDEFLHNCKRFYESRLKGTPWEDPSVEEAVTSSGSPTKSSRKATEDGAQKGAE